MEKYDQTVRLIIQDNGAGFHLPDNWFEEAKRGHMGLIGMRERAEAIGGQLDIHSEYGNGTQVVVTISFGEPPT